MVYKKHLRVTSLFFSSPRPTCFTQKQTKHLKNVQKITVNDLNLNLYNKKNIFMLGFTCMSCSSAILCPSLCVTLMVSLPFSASSFFVRVILQHLQHNVAATLTKLLTLQHTANLTLRE